MAPPAVAEDACSEQISKFHTFTEPSRALVTRTPLSLEALAKARSVIAV